MGHSKGGKDRYVCVDLKTRRRLRDWQGDRPPGDAIFGIEAGVVGEVMKKYGSRVGLVQKYEGMLRSFSPHSLRHAFATHRLDAGMDLDALKMLLGHEYLATTLIYVQTSMRRVRRQYRETDPLRGK